MPDAAAETRATYDRLADRYAARAVAGHPGLAADVAWFRAAIGAAGTVADVGCGPGRDTLLLRAAGLRAIGLDLSLGQLRAGGGPGFVQADMRALPVRTAGLDGLWSSAALLHLEPAHVPAALAEFGRVTRPGGILVLTVAEGDGAGFEAAEALGSPLRRWFTYHREPALTAQLAAAGFTVTGVRREQARRRWLQLRGTRQ